MQGCQKFMLKIIDSNKKIFAIAIFISFVFTFCMYGKNYSDKIHANIANQIMRLRVIANSDSNFDQALKLKVRDSILNLLGKQLASSKSKLQTKMIIARNLQLINSVAKQAIKDNGYDYDVKTQICTDAFPTKKYGDIILPAGSYDTLKIIIGTGAGHNWWCVMFPPLCFVDVTKKTIPQNLKSNLKKLLPDEEFKIINCENEKGLPIKIKFKIVEAWQNFQSKNKLGVAANE